MKSIRLPQLDYLRGLAAVGICFYHLILWNTNQVLSASSILGKIGVYGVTIFYLLSGYTLALVYQKVDFRTKTEWKIFFLKRFFRIYPLLWFSTLFTLFYIQANHSSLEILLNLTGLFGLFSWDKYIATGAWSIGNELFFYLSFPFLMWLRKNSRISFTVIGMIFFLMLLYQSFYLLVPTIPLSSQWPVYISPFSQIFFFYIGIAIQPIRLGQRQLVGIFILLFLAIVFYLLPVDGDQITLVTGWLRIVFVLLCISFVLILAHIKVGMDNPIHFVLNWLGEISYSVYLLHPICFKIWPPLFRFTNLPVGYFWETLVVFIFLSSTIMYYFFEKSFIRLGQYMTKRK
ncbi:MAG: acyltransferase family protein [Spirosomataceae bacterium]